MKKEDKIFLRALRGEMIERPPIWLMRQAGRYLPEYREVRSTAKNFLDFCYSPDLAVEVTLQPIRRFGFDASIMFADILLIPDALGQSVRFEEGVGPVLEPLETEADIDRLNADGLHNHMAPVYETLRRLSKELPEETALIGFAGAPWTVATYMIGGRGSPTQAAAKLMSYRRPDLFKRLIDLLVNTTADYLCAQVNAGAEVLQIFDTWAGSLTRSGYEMWCLDPIRRIVEKVHMQHPDVPIIGFPKGIGPLIVSFAQQSGVQGLSIDTGMDLDWAKRNVDGVTLQGNLDPLSLVAGGDEMRRDIDFILETMRDRPFVFNLGHGIVPETPTDHVDELVKTVQAWRR